MEGNPKKWFAARLRAYLHECHPRLEKDEALVERRSMLATALYARAREKG